MTYKFKYTEKNVAKASEFETRALLFLITSSTKKDLIHYLFIDCFNDISGAGEKCEEIFDIQSKGLTSLTPGKVGKSLITLFENSLSGFNFSHFILFLQHVDPKYLQDPSLKVFSANNFGIQYKKVKEGLRNEYFRRHPDLKADEKTFDCFLSNVQFVVDNNTKPEYIKLLTSFKNINLKPDALFESIFKDIQIIQHAKKIIKVEDIEILNVQDALAFNKHLNIRDLQILIINRLIGIEIFNDNRVPMSFVNTVSSLEIDQRKDLILECNTNLSRALFDKNTKEDFWSFLESAILEVRENPENTPEQIYASLEDRNQVRTRYMKYPAGVYLISLIKDGLDK